MILMIIFSLAPIYAGSIAPDLRATCVTLSSIINGIATILKSIPYGKTFKLKHDTNGLRDFYVFYEEVKLKAEANPVVIFESTGHYHEPVLRYLEERRITYYLVNPVISYQTKKSSLRKVKSDPADARHLCLIYYKEDLETFQRKNVQTMNLRNLSRQYDSLTRN